MKIVVVIVILDCSLQNYELDSTQILISIYIMTVLAKCDVPYEASSIIQFLLTLTLLATIN